MDGSCVFRCADGKSFNRYYEYNDLPQCLTYYDLFDHVAENNELIINAKSTNSLGGSLSEPLVCNDDTEIKTVYSEKLID